MCQPILKPHHLLGLSTELSPDSVLTGSTSRVRGQSPDNSGTRTRGSARDGVVTHGSAMFSVRSGVRTQHLSDVYISIPIHISSILHLYIVCILYFVKWPHPSTNQRAAFHLSEPPAEIVVSSSSHRRRLLFFLNFLLAQACKQSLSNSRFIPVLLTGLTATVPGKFCGGLVIATTFRVSLRTTVSQNYCIDLRTY